MTETVLARRFINTPTLMEAYAAENPETAVDAPDDKVNDLSDEYDTVTGSEGLYYQFLFDNLQRPYSADAVTGNEGFVSWIGDMVSRLIDAIKNFFKWVYNFFTGKNKVAARQTKDLELQLSKNGVKKHFTHYPKGYSTLWMSKAKTPANLDWVTKAMNDWQAAASKVDAYIKQVGDSVEKAEALLLGKGQMSQSKEGFDKLFKDHQSAIVKIFGGDPATFIGGTHISINQHGKLVLKPDPELLEDQHNAGFISSETKTRELLGVVSKANDKFDNVVGNSVKLEKVLIKNLEKSLSFSKSTELENEKAAQAIAGGMKEIITDGMSGIKALETLLFKVYQVAYLIVKASVDIK